MTNGPVRLAAGAVVVSAALLLGAPLALAETEGGGDALESLVVPPTSPSGVDEQPSTGDYSYTVAATSETLDEPGEALVTVAVALTVATAAVELPG